MLLLVFGGCGGGDDEDTAASQGEQVAAGGDVYAAECAQCHGEQGEGGTGPVLIGGSRRIATYENTTRLYDYVSRTMPFDEPGSLTEDQYWNAIAFILAENGLLPEGTVLGPDAGPVELTR